MSKRTIWHLEVPPHLNKRLEHYLKEDSFKTKSEFIRTAVRDRLEKENKKLASEQIGDLANEQE